MAGKRPKKQPAETPAASPIARRVGVVFLTLAVAGGVVWGVARLGEEARRGIGPRDRYAVRFADIDCPAPPGLDRPAFLAEVRYAANAPETLQALDPELTPKLTADFASHPWVAAVEGVTVESDHRVRVALKFRTPTLAVTLTGGGTRVVDGDGVLLPASADSAGLPELVSPLPPPTTPAGQAWPDPVVKRAAELVEVHHPRKLEKIAQGWRLTTADGKTLVRGP